MNEFTGLVRILNQENDTVGAGYLVSQDGIIVSCAHVIENAGYPVSTYVRIQVEGNDSTLNAKVEEGYWKDWNEAKKSDIAFLRINDSDFVRPSPVSTSSSEWIVDKHAQVFGFPFLKEYKADRMAVKVLGLVNNEDGEARLRLETEEALKKSNPVLGMSGGPIMVVEDQQNIFVGIFVEFFEGTNRAWAIPAEKILELCPEFSPELPGEIDTYVKAVLQFCKEIPTVGTKDVFLNKIYVRQNLYNKDDFVERTSINIPVSDAILKFKKMFIIGGAGLGKSTLLRYITDYFARQRVDGKPVLPIFISAKGLAEKTLSFEKALLEQIEVELNIRLTREIPSGFLKDWQRKAGGIWLISLDGVDEIRDPYQKKKFMDNLAGYQWPPESIVILTSRPDTSIDFPPEYQILELAPFGQKQTEEFIDLWFGDDMQKKQVLKRKLRSDLKALSETPLLLTLVTQVFDRLNSLPSSRVDTYYHFINLLLDIRSPADLDVYGENWALRQTHQLLVQQYPYIGERVFNERKKLFERIAFGYYEYQDIYKIVRDTFNLSTTSEAQGILQIFSSQRIGLLTKLSHYEFVHGTLRDFLAAQRLVDVFHMDVAQIWEWLENKWDDNIRSVAIFALVILNKHGIKIQDILNQMTQDLEGLLFLSEYISFSGEINKFGDKVIALLCKSARSATRVEYLLGESAVEGLKNLSHYPSITNALRQLVDDRKVDNFVRQEILRILADAVDADKIAEYILSKDTSLARESVRILSEKGEFDRLIVLSQSKSLDYLVTLEVIDSLIKSDHRTKIIDALPRHQKNDAFVKQIADELIEKENYSFVEDFMLQVGQSPDVSSITKEDVLLRLFPVYLTKIKNIKSEVVVNALKAVKNENNCAKLFELFIRRGGIENIARVFIYLIYDLNFAHQTIRLKIINELENTNSLEDIGKLYFLNDFLDYFQKLGLDINYLAKSNTYDLANLILSEDAGFTLHARTSIRKKIMQKKYWRHFMPIMEVNQSTKFEQTSDDTILLSCNPEDNGPFYSVIIPSEVKVTIIKYLRNKGNSKLKSLLKAFAASLALLIAKSDTGAFEFHVDEEYSKHSKEIKAYLLHYLPKGLIINEDAIKFVPYVVFSPRSSNLALEVKHGLRQVNSIVNSNELLSLLSK